MTAVRPGGASPADAGAPRILLAEDDREMRVLLAEQLRHDGYEVVECCDGQGLVAHLSALFLPGAEPEEFDLVISNIRMPAFSGLEVLDGLHGRAGCPPVILITAFGDEQTHERARRLGAVATFDKPFRIPDLLAVVRQTVAPAEG